MFGTRLIDLLSPSGQEVAAFGSCNTNSGAFIRLYDSNLLNQGYLIGKSNSTFVINRNTNLPISVGIGTTFAPNNTCVIQGSLSTSNIISYNTDNTLYFSNTNVTGINNINFSGTLLQNGQSLKTSQWENSGQNIVFPGKVGIGTTSIFSSGSCNLYVSGDVWIDGKINASNLNIYGEVLASSLTLSYNNPSNDGTKTILTNDISYQGRIVSSFQLTPGRYMISLNIPYTNLTGANLLDTVSWLNINLYQSRVIDFNSSSVALRTYQITGITDNGSITLYWLYDTPGNMQNYSDHVIALEGKGHQIKLASNYSMMCIPIRGLGYDDKITVRQSLSVNPIKSSKIITNPTDPNNKIFNLNANGYLTASASNIDVYIAGSKIPYSDSTGNYYNYVINYNNNNSQTTFTITLADAIASMLIVDDVVDINIFPEVVADTYFSSGYLYQSIVTSSTPWTNVVGGGVRIGDRVAIDGDLYVRGNIWGGCNTNIFASGVTYTGLPAINAASNIIGTTNLIDGAVTIPKLNLLNGNVGIGTTFAKARLDINGNINIDGNIFQNGLPYIGSQWIGPTSGPIYFNSNIGIGTTIPRNSVAIVGNVGIGSTYSGVNAPLNSLIIEGNIGIGTTTPRNRLAVVGNVGIGSTYSGVNAPLNSLIVEGNIGIGSTIPNNSLTIVNNVGIGSTYSGVVAPANSLIIEGNIGIGTTTPRSRLAVVGNVGIGSTFSGIAAPLNSLIVEGNIGIGTTIPSNRLSISNNVGIGSTYSGVNAPLNSLIIEGNIGIGSTRPAFKLDVLGDVRATTNGRFNIAFIGDVGHGSGWAGFSHTSSISTTAYALLQSNTGETLLNAASGQSIFFRINNGNVGYINTGGLLVTGDITGFGSVSDRRLKENIESLPSCIKEIMKLNVVEFNWNINVPNKEKIGKKDIGLIAQEVEEILPLIVEENDIVKFDDNEDKCKIIRYEKIIPYLIKGMQEQQKQIENLTYEIKELRDRLS